MNLDLSSTEVKIFLLLYIKKNAIIGIEIKARSKVTAKDFIHLEALKNDLGNQFLRGFVLYNGNDIVPFGVDMWALPLTSLWA